MSTVILSNPAGVHPPVGAYSHAAFVPAGAALLFVAGQVGVRPDGSLPADFAGQADQAYANVVQILKSAGLGPESVVKLTVFVVAGQPIAEARAARLRHLGEARPASTAVFVPALVAPEYLIEVEAVAAK